ncbi:NUDIX domain-containing protein [Roseomonas marmotae]|uniref:ADP-ribose pyrophosphatase n=1 Tax=Roseomonas marmotae TaxID=2768161 RepID=A0ABS3K941_9PROT|nr:NUDIX domain-containing protein [Roseomonas marmotae]MBO1073972.1 NUDIX domain-containing protein [Roseomonas marmotae]QTI78764.1 NUDIX domain-containing protein [Roseomonas marmotae]
MKARPAKAPVVPAHPLYVPESDEVVWDGRFPLQKVRFRYRRFDGSLSGTLTWEMWRRGQAVVILPYDPWTHRIALVEQFRLPVLAAGEDPISREVPAGLLEPHEDPAACGIRELQEEAGLTPDRVEGMGNYLLMHGACDERVHFYAARVHLPEPGEGRTMGLETEHEETRVVILDADEAFAMMARNEIRNACGAICMLWLQLNSPRLRQEWTA